MNDAGAKNSFPVEELPFIESLTELSTEDRKRFGLYLAGGSLNNYRLAKMTGLGGSRKEPTWDKTTRRHSCCQSAAPWRHKVNCPLLQGNLPPEE